MSLVLIFLGVVHSSFIPHLNPSLLHPFPLIFKSKTRPSAPVSLSNIHSLPTVQVIAFRHVQAAIWHGHPVPSSTTVPPLSVALCLFSCVLVVSYLGSFHNPWDLHQKPTQTYKYIQIRTPPKPKRKQKQKQPTKQNQNQNHQNRKQK